MNSIRNGIDRFNKVLGAVEDWLCCGLLVLMSLCVFLQIVCRLANFPLTWSEELSRFMFIWLIYFGLCIATRRDSHLCCDILPIIVKGRSGKLIIKIISNALSLVFFGFIAYYGTTVLQKMALRVQTSPAMHVNMFYVYLVMFVAFFIACLHFIILIVLEVMDLIEGDKKEGGDEA